MDRLNRMVLVLNKGWTAIHITTVKDAIGDVFQGDAKFIHTDMNTYTWEDWVSLPAPQDDCIHYSKGCFTVPLVMVLNDYNDIKQTDLKLNRKNVFLRDAYKCQYCGKRVTLKSGTWDHIIPRSKGGKNTWGNLATACKPCNTRKRNRTPEEAGLHRPNVSKPKWFGISTKLTAKSPEFWFKFLPEKSLPDYISQE